VNEASSAGGERERPAVRELDVRQLMGFDEQPDAVEDDDWWADFGRTDPDDVRESRNQWLVRNGDEFPVAADGEPLDVLADGAKRLLRAVVERRDPSTAIVNRLAEWLARLEDPYRTVVVNHFWHEYEAREIGQALDVSTTTVHFILDAALAQLDDWFQV
jgi:DNA-directed RNA polymerase specialized sigma24 family protein